jgi:outer membrane protein assembly factor BamB
MFNHPQLCRSATSFGFVLIVASLFAVAARTEPSITLSKKSGPPTSRILVSGRGFNPNVGLDIYFDSKKEALVVTDDKGGFENARIQAPRNALPGKHWVKALEGSFGNGAHEPFLVQTNWNQFHFTPEHDGVNPYENLLSPQAVGHLELKWTYGVGSSVASSPVVANGIVYVGSTAEPSVFYALNGETGDELWGFEMSTIFAGAAAVADRVVYAEPIGGPLYALDAKSGVVIWSDALPDSDASPAITNGVIYTAAASGGSNSWVYALNANTGGVIWQFAIVCCTGSSPAVANGVVYIGSEDNNVYALDAISGAEFWSYATGGYVLSSPAVADAVVYVGSDDGNLYALDAGTGTKLWSYTTGGPVDSSPVVAGAVVYVGSGDGGLYALDAETGTKMWSYTTSGPVRSSPAVADGVLYIGSDDGNVYALDAEKGTKLWSYTTGGPVDSSPAVANGMVYVGSDDGSVYAFGLPDSSRARQGASASRH